MEDVVVENPLPTVVDDFAGASEIVTNLEDIRDSVDLSNMINAGLLFFLGCLFGLLFMWIFWGRFR
ncbi:MAG: hypothetical protein GX663_08980 [Clostridiales bacterium]|nr:hypothetical protein [Clostridiales bacterium]